MSETIVSHLTVLEQSASVYDSLPAFRLPFYDPDTSDVQGWDAISYAQFKHDVEVYARHWTRTLRLDGVPPRSVVGMW